MRPRTLARRTSLLCAAVTVTALLAGACAAEQPPPVAGDIPAPPANLDVDSAPGPPSPTADGDLEVHFIDVGQGDATLLVAPDATLLVDTGDWQRDDVVTYLSSVGVTTVDVVAVTHPHADHLGQFDRVLDTFDVNEVWWSGATHTTATFERAVDALERSDAHYEEPRAGDVTTVGSLLVEFVNPPPTANFSDLHDSGLAFRVTYGQVSFLFTGDAETSTEARMSATDAATLNATIYQVGHHGSQTSTTSVFLAAVSPQVAIYSAGAGNQYGHPHPDVIQRLLDADVDVYGTDTHGTIIVTTDGTRWDLSTSEDRASASLSGWFQVAAVQREERAPPEI